MMKMENIDSANGEAIVLDVCIYLFFFDVFDWSFLLCQICIRQGDNCAIRFFGMHPLRRKLFHWKENPRNSTIFFSRIYLFGHHSFDNISLGEKTFGEIHIGNNLSNRYYFNTSRQNFRFLRCILFSMVHMLKVSKK